MSRAMTPWASEEIRPACGAGRRVRSQFRAGRADKTVGLIHQVEHRRNDERAGNHPDNERDLLLPRRRIDELTGLEILQIVICDRGDVENYRCGEKRESHQRLARLPVRHTVLAQHKQQGRADHHQNSNAGKRAVRRTNQPRHVTADRRNEETHQARHKQRRQ